MSEKPTFKWSNYYRPTPKNLENLMIGLKVMLGTWAGTELANQNPYTASYILIATGLLDHLAKFFAKANEDYVKTITTTITGPADQVGQVDVKTETTNEPK